MMPIYYEGGKVDMEVMAMLKRYHEETKVTRNRRKVAKLLVQILAS